MCICVRVNKFSKVAMGREQKESPSKRKLFSQHHHQKNTPAMDIFEGRLQSELIGEGWGELSDLLTFYNGSQRSALQPTASCNEWFGHFRSKRKGSSSFSLFVSLREVTTFPLLLATSDYWVGSLQKSSFVVTTLIFSPVLKCLVRRRSGSGKPDLKSLKITAEEHYL